MSPTMSPTVTAKNETKVLASSDASMQQTLPLSKATSNQPSEGAPQASMNASRSGTNPSPASNMNLKNNSSMISNARSNAGGEITGLAGTQGLPQPNTNLEGTQTSPSGQSMPSTPGHRASHGQGQGQGHLQAPNSSNNMNQQGPMPSSNGTPNMNNNMHPNLQGNGLMQPHGNQGYGEQNMNTHGYGNHLHGGNMNMAGQGGGMNMNNMGSGFNNSMGGPGMGSMGGPGQGMNMGGGFNTNMGGQGQMQGGVMNSMQGRMGMNGPGPSNTPAGSYSSPPHGHGGGQAHTPYSQNRMGGYTDGNQWRYYNPRETPGPYNSNYDYQYGGPGPGQTPTHGPPPGMGPSNGHAHTPLGSHGPGQSHGRPHPIGMGAPPGPGYGQSGGGRYQGMNSMYGMNVNSVDTPQGNSNNGGGMGNGPGPMNNEMGGTKRKADDSNQNTTVGPSSNGQNTSTTDMNNVTSSVPTVSPGHDRPDEQTSATATSSNIKNDDSSTSNVNASAGDSNVNATDASTPNSSSKANDNVNESQANKKPRLSDASHVNTPNTASTAAMTPPMSSLDANHNQGPNANQNMNMSNNSSSFQQSNNHQGGPGGNSMGNPPPLNVSMQMNSPDNQGHYNPHLHDGGYYPHSGPGMNPNGGGGMPFHSQGGSWNQHGHPHNHGHPAYGGPGHSQSGFYYDGMNDMDMSHGPPGHHHHGHPHGGHPHGGPIDDYNRNPYFQGMGYSGHGHGNGPHGGGHPGNHMPHTPYGHQGMDKSSAFVSPEHRQGHPNQQGHGQNQSPQGPGGPQSTPGNGEEGEYTKLLKSKGARLTDRKKLQNKAWFDRFEELKEYKAEHGDCLVPQKYPPNPSLGTWVNKQRMEYKLLMDRHKSSMTNERLTALQGIGFTWAKRKGQATWDAKFLQLKQYKVQHGDCLIPTKYSKDLALGRWVSTQREQYRLWKEGDLKSKMNQERARKLEEVGFVWRLQF